MPKCYLCPDEGNNKFFDYPLCDFHAEQVAKFGKICVDAVRRESEERSEPHAKRKEIPPKGV